MPRTVLAFLLALTLPGSLPARAVATEGGDFDLQGFVDKAVRSGSKRIVIPPGRHRVTPRNREHLVLRDLDGVEIVATGVEMICTETTRALTIAHCRNLRLRGLSIDYDPLPFTQGRIVALSDRKDVLEVELFAGYPLAEAVVPEKFEIFARESRTLRTHDYGIQRPEVLDSRHLRIRKDGARPTDLERVGDIIAINAAHAPGGSIPHAVYADRCVALTLVDVELFASNCFGFFETRCEGSMYLHCRVDRRPPSTDLVAREDPRIRSLDADAFHSKFAPKGPALVECVARYMGDDAVNICGNYHMVMACRGARLRVLANGEMPSAEEPVEVVTYEGVRLPDAVVKSVERSGKITEAERAFLLAQRMDEGLRTRWTPDAYEVTLDRRLDLARGAVIGSTRRVGNGFVVKGCTFGHNRSRGVLIKASQGEVIGNTLAGSRMEAIKVSPEYWWLESGSSNDVRIDGNTISDCDSIAIAVYAHGGSGAVAPSGAHRRIAIVGNAIRDCPLPNIAVTSTDGLTIEDNTLLPSSGPRDAGWAIGHLGLDRAGVEAVMTARCTAVARSNNRVESR